MFEKLDIRNIISDHTKTFRNENNNSPSFSDVVIFIYLPIAVASYFVGYGMLLTSPMITMLIASLSIFVGLLLNLLVLLIGMIDKLKEKIIKALNDQTENGVELFSYSKSMLDKRNRLLKETYSNISFAILLSLVSIPLLIISLVTNPIVKQISNLINYSFLLAFFFTLLMVLKRIHVLFSEELK